MHRPRPATDGRCSAKSRGALARPAVAVGSWLIVIALAAAFVRPAHAAQNGPTTAQEQSAAPDAPSAETAPSAEAAPVVGPVNFSTDIQPILQEHCLKCHGPEKR